MDYNLEGKSVFISGSTSGIGLSTAELLIKEGAKVIINGRSAISVSDALDLIKSKYPVSKISGIATDFSKPSEIHKLIKRLPDIDILINLSLIHI